MLQWQGSRSYSLRSLRLSQRQTGFLVKAELAGIGSRNGPMRAFLVWSPAACQAKYRQGIPELVVQAPAIDSQVQDCQ